MNFKISKDKWIKNNKKHLESVKNNEKVTRPPITAESMKQVGIMDFKINPKLYKNTQKK